MSKPSFKVVLKDKTVAIVESAGGVCIHGQFDNMLVFNDKESGEVVAMFPVNAIALVGKSGAVSKEDAKGMEAVGFVEMGQDSKPCQQEDATGKRSYRAMYHAQKKKADCLSCEAEALYKQVCELKSALTAKDREIRALKSNDRSWVGAPTRQNHGDCYPFGDGFLPIHFKVMS